jgi:hypothetical protein
MVTLGWRTSQSSFQPASQGLLRVVPVRFTKPLDQFRDFNSKKSIVDACDISLD